MVPSCIFLWTLLTCVSNLSLWINQCTGYPHKMHIILSQNAVMIWKYLPFYWPFLIGIPQRLTDFPLNWAVVGSFYISSLSAWKSCQTCNHSNKMQTAYKLQIINLIIEVVVTDKFHCILSKASEMLHGAVVKPLRKLLFSCEMNNSGWRSLWPGGGYFTGP